MPASRPRRAAESPPPWEGRPIRVPESLPIAQRRREIVESLRQSQVLVLAGETGSGKSTQLPKLCLEAGLGRRGRIACSQPRRVAALSLARRVAEELGATYGREVGSKIRFDDRAPPAARVKFLTDGMLLSEIQGDPLLREYEAVIIDEAHERSLNIDFLLGYLNQLRRRRPDLKIVVTSATIDTAAFAAAFDDAPVIEVSGRAYPVEVVYAPLEELLEGQDDATHIEGVAAAVQRIREDCPPGDILAFLPTEKDIREAQALLEGRFGPKLAILPCFGRLSSADQQRIFAPAPKPKLVLATNIAETSLTIPGIRYVVDTGLARLSRYSARTRTRRLPIEKIAQSSANQRKGRCGRIAEGVCVRLYSEKDFESRPYYTTPEIQRSNLAEVILRMKAFGLGEIETFPFLDPPAPAAIRAGYDLLAELGALDEGGRLTQLGRELARLPVDPTAGRMLLQAETEGATEPMLAIVAALSIQDPRERPMDKEALAEQAHRGFRHPQSDFLSLLNIWETCHEQCERLSQSQLRRYCRQRFLSYPRMREWIEVRDQLERALAARRKRSAMPAKSSFTYADEAEKAKGRSYGGVEYQAIHRCLVSGLLANPARKEEPNLYRSTGDRKVMVFPGSGLFDKKAAKAKRARKKLPPEEKRSAPAPQWILAGEIMETSRLYARNVAMIDPAWLVELGQSVIRRRFSEPIWDPDKGRVLVRESLRLRGLEVRSRRVSYLKVDPEKATEIFIREALLDEEFRLPQPFLEKNRQLKQRIQNIKTTVDAAHWIGVEEAAFRFYRQRLQNVASVHDLNRGLKRRGDPEGKSLEMAEADLLPEDDPRVDPAAFPKSIALENAVLPVKYRYRPGGENDGVALQLPYDQVKSLDDAFLDWLVPGHLEAKTLHALRALPKDLRRRLHPLPDTAKAIAQTLRPSKRSFLESLAERLESDYGIETYESDWRGVSLPGHLQVRAEVVDADGEVVARGADAASVRAQLAQREQALSQAPDDQVEGLWAKARSRFERPVESAEALAGVPEQLEIGRHRNLPVRAYPGLRDIGQDVRLRLFRSAEDAARASRFGAARLLERELRRELAWLREDLEDLRKLGPGVAAFAPLPSLKTHAYAHLRRELCRYEGAALDAAALAARARQAKEESRGLAYKLLDRLAALLDKRQQLKTGADLPADLQAEVDRLAPPDLLLRVPGWALPRVPLYLETVAARAALRRRDPESERQREARVAHFRRRFAALAPRPPSPDDLHLPPETDLGWAIEEYALSLFAQRLGAAFPVSPKRLEARFQALAQAGPAAPQATAASEAKKPAAPAPDKPTRADLESLKKAFGR